MAHLSNSFVFDSYVVDLLENFVCKLYGSDGKCVNKLHFQRFVTNAGASNLMPPCRNALNQHCHRANYIAALWKSAALSNINAPIPCNHGWILFKNQYEFLWH